MKNKIINLSNIKYLMLKLYKNENELEVGVDEAGRGCLMGRVYAAAVIMPNEFEDVTELINNLGIEKETSEYVKYAQSQKICSFPKERLIKVSETKTMKYGDYIEWQVKKVKGEAV